MDQAEERLLSLCQPDTQLFLGKKNATINVGVVENECV
jgi:hypothetical protein